jgi:predicted MFS family arabinose efflux permease
VITAASVFLPVIRNDTHKAAAGKRKKNQNSSSVLRFPGWISVFTLYFSVGILLNIFPLYAKYILDMPERLIGLSLFFRALAATAGYIFFGNFHFWHFKKRYMLVFQFIMIIMPLLFLASSVFVLLSVVMILWGFFSSYIYVSSVFHGASGSPDREKRMAVHEALLTFGSLAGTSSGGFLLGKYSMTAVFGTAAAAALAGFVIELIIFLIIYRKAKTGGRS